jgi:sugar/nucleoside kinase (ribokinase family)
MPEARRVYAGPSIESDRVTSRSAGEPAADRTPDLVVAGAASRDRAEGDDRGWRLGGPATYCSLAAARLGLRVGCVLGVDDLAASARELVLLRQAGVDLRLVPLARGPVFDNIEVDGHRRQRWLSRSDTLTVDALPRDWRGAGMWLLVPVAGEMPDEWSRLPAAEARVGLGWQGLLRDFAAEGWVERVGPAVSPLIDRAGLVCASTDDLIPDFDIDAVRRIASGATLVLTAGAEGGLVIDGKAMTRYPAVTAGPVRDATGAGDVFLATLMAAWLVTGNAVTQRSLRFAAAAASLAVEGVGLLGVPTKAAVAERLGRRSGGRVGSAG